MNSAVWTYFSQQHPYRSYIQAGNGRQIDPHDSEVLLPPLFAAGFAHLLAPFRISAGAFQVFQLFANLPVAVADEVLIMPMALQRLLQREQMFGSVVSLQRRHDALLAGFHPPMAQLRQPARIPLPCQNGVHNRKPAHPCQIAQHPVDLYVHLIQRLLHVLDVAGSPPPPNWPDAAEWCAARKSPAPAGKSLAAIPPRAGTAATPSRRHPASVPGHSCSGGHSPNTLRIRARPAFGTTESSTPP